MTKPSKTSRTSSRVIAMLTLQKRTIIETIITMTTDQPPIVTGTIPLLVKMRIKTHPHTAVVIVLTNTLVQTNVVTPVRHALVINADSAKTVALNGLIAQCTLLPQVHKQNFFFDAIGKSAKPKKSLWILFIHKRFCFTATSWIQLSFLLPHKWHPSLCQV